eukprot:Opistho-2@86022
MGELSVEVIRGRDRFPVIVPPTATVREFQALVHASTNVLPEHQKLVCSGKTLFVGVDAHHTSVDECGIRSGMKILLVGSTPGDIEKTATQHVATHSASEGRRTGGAPVARIQSTSALLGAWYPPGRDEYGFQSIAVIDAFTNPPASEARALLERLASDPGILSVMRSHRWRVGVLSELIPKGKVGFLRCVFSATTGTEGWKYPCASAPTTCVAFAITTRSDAFCCTS